MQQQQNNSDSDSEGEPLGKKKRLDYYELSDPFIDDSELIVCPSLVSSFVSF
eukprot:CAMPEP_0175115002 /NCGR_PEP_ID=MMETSP0086_2-20121207/17243_1 /TAXON_ID=136419 /ORGANISM="Unknown Unknown, Strain D1" /LENGTH=51 /DNA_ID=CAMNT_0016394861 /DNA_START=123 /DNA_END=275 /DNA_ORIENTATION=-